jgi:hypothetical protein
MEGIRMRTTLDRPEAKLATLTLLALLAVGCTKTFVIRPVPPPGEPYPAATGTEPHSLGISDARGDAGKSFSKGTIRVDFEGMDDQIAYLADNVVAVLNAEGIKVVQDKSGNADVKLKVLTYRMRNLRSNGFSPYHTFTTFSAELAGDPPRRITAYFKNSKTPVWAFREIERPCYQIALEVVVKEIAAKLNARVYGRVASTATVERIAASIPSGDSDSASEQYLKVLELGYTNNPAAIPILVRLTNRGETLMRASAISALGILGATDQLPLLKTLYANGADELTKSMALKSIGDLDTPEAHDFLNGVKQSKDYQKEDTIREVVDLYP